MTHTEVRTPTHATSTVNAWLQEFDEALQARDIQRVLTLFNDECYWRDFLAFTWNLKTCEGKEEIQAMLDATLANTQPTQWQLDGEASENGDTIEAWFTFKTAIASGKG